MVNIRLRGTVCTCGYYSARVIGTAQFSFLILTLDLASGASGRSLQKHLRSRPCQIQLLPQTVILSPISFVFAATFIK